MHYDSPPHVAVVAVYSDDGVDGSDVESLPFS